MDGDTRCRVWCHDRIYVVEPLWLCNCVPPSSSYAYLQLGKSSGVVSFVGCFLPLFPECVWVVRGRNTLCQFCFRCSKCSMFRSNPIKEDSCVFLSRALYISVCFVTGRLLWRKRFKHGRMSIRAYGWPSFSWLHGGYIKVHGSRKSPDLSCNNKISITTTVLTWSWQKMGRASGACTLLPLDQDNVYCMSSYLMVLVRALILAYPQEYIEPQSKGH